LTRNTGGSPPNAVVTGGPASVGDAEAVLLDDFVEEDFVEEDFDFEELEEREEVVEDESALRTKVEDVVDGSAVKARSVIPKSTCPFVRPQFSTIQLFASSLVRAVLGKVKLDDAAVIPYACRMDCSCVVWADAVDARRKRWMRGSMVGGLY